eukprot:1194897-Prorocentrum_minimum.AAC.3
MFVANPEACVWDAETGDARRTLRGHTQAVKCLAWSPDDLTLVSASQDGTARCWRCTWDQVELDGTQKGGDSTGNKSGTPSGSGSLLPILAAADEQIRASVLPATAEEGSDDEVDNQTVSGGIGWHAALSQIHFSLVSHRCHKTASLWTVGHGVAPSGFGHTTVQHLHMSKRTPRTPVLRSSSWAAYWRDTVQPRRDGTAFVLRVDGVK